MRNKAKNIDISKAAIFSLYAWCMRFNCQSRGEESLRRGYEHSKGREKWYDRSRARDKVQLVNQFPDREYGQQNNGAEILDCRITGIVALQCITS